MILAFKLGFLEVSIVDLIDIALVTLLLTQAYKLIRGSLAIRVFIGFLFLYLLFLVVKAAGMELVTNILGQFMGVGVLAVIILFQQEIRKFLLLVGRTTTLDEGNFMQSLRSLWSNGSAMQRSDVSALVDASKTLGASNTGGLIVISKSSELKFYADSGDRLDASISKRLLLSIFNKYSPLHDGAVIVHDNKIVAARCILPVTERDDLPAHYGLRHRAAIGMSEATDTLLIVISEETGQMSVVKSGQIFSNISAKEMRTMTNEYLSGEDQPSAFGKDQANPPVEVAEEA